MEYPVGKLTVVSENNQPLGVVIEPPDGEDPLGYALYKLLYRLLLSCPSPSAVMKSLGL
jgi:hypothetical protein